MDSRGQLDLRDAHPARTTRDQPELVEVGDEGDGKQGSNIDVLLVGVGELLRVRVARGDFGVRPVSAGADDSHVVG